MRECVDESVLQAFFDAELTHERMQRIASHLTTCCACVDLAREVEAENAMLASAFEPERSLSVPSEELWSRINYEIRSLEASTTEDFAPEQSSVWERLKALFTLPSPARLGLASGFAALVICVIAGVVYLGTERPVNPETIAEIEPGNGGLYVPPPPAYSLNTTPGPLADVATSRPLASTGKPKRRPGMTGIRLNNPPPIRAGQPLAGEAGYLKAIASLTGALEATGERALRPSVRADYERNVAIVDRAIDATRRTARQNPQDKDAVAFLYASYQSKVDLLNAVADQTLIASR